MANKHKLSLGMRITKWLLLRQKNKIYLRGNMEQNMMELARKFKLVPPWKKIPTWVDRQFEITAKEYRGEMCYFLKPRHKQPQKYLVYLHGSAYFLTIAKFHWEFIARLALLTDSFVCVPLYPLAPEHNYTATPPVLEEFYKDLCCENKSNLPVNIIGDSAGAGIALSFAQMIRNQGLPLAKKVILLSPSIDMTPLTQEEEVIANRIDQDDCFLSIRMINTVRRWWCGGNDYKNYFASPIYGGLRGLNEIWVFTSTHDILNIAAKRLQKQAMREGVKINFVERENLPHVWMFFLKTKEGKSDLKYIADIINQNSNNL